MANRKEKIAMRRRRSKTVSLKRMKKMRRTMASSNVLIAGWISVTCRGCQSRMMHMTSQTRWELMNTN
jgi:hypothetical protein